MHRMDNLLDLLVVLKVSYSWELLLRSQASSSLKII